MKPTEYSVLKKKLNELQATVQALVNFHLEHAEKALAVPSDEASSLSQLKKSFTAEKKRILKELED